MFICTEYGLTKVSSLHTKTFASSVDELDDEIEQWLKENPDIVIVKMLFSSDDTTLNTQIWYHE